jgi:hypothetical protein
VEVEGSAEKSAKAGRLAPLFIVSARFHSLLLNLQNPTTYDLWRRKRKVGKGGRIGNQRTLINQFELGICIGSVSTSLRCGGVEEKPERKERQAESNPFFLSGQRCFPYEFCRFFLLIIKKYIPLMNTQE